MPLVAVRRLHRKREICRLRLEGQIHHDLLDRRLAGKPDAVLTAAPDPFVYFQGLQKSGPEILFRREFLDIGEDLLAQRLGAARIAVDLALYFLLARQVVIRNRMAEQLSAIVVLPKTVHEGGPVRAILAATRNPVPGDGGTNEAAVRGFQIRRLALIDPDDELPIVGFGVTLPCFKI